MRRLWTTVTRQLSPAHVTFAQQRIQLAADQAFSVRGPAGSAKDTRLLARSMASMPEQQGRTSPTSSTSPASANEPDSTGSPPAASTASPVLFFEKPLNVLVHLDEQLLVEQQLKSELKPKPNESRTHWIQTTNALFRCVRRAVLYLLHQRYTVYPITTEELRSKPWTASTKLLLMIQRDPIGESELLAQPASQSIRRFKEEGGAVCMLDVRQICSDEQRCFELEESFLSDRFAELLRKHLGQAFFELADENTGAAAAGDSTLDAVVPTITAHFLYSAQPVQLLGRLQVLHDSLDGSGYRLIELGDPANPADKANADSQAKAVLRAGQIPLMLCSSTQPAAPGFDLARYFHCLGPVRLGRQVVFAEVTRSTHPLCELLGQLDDLVVVANQQVEGRGRGENHWISPAGSVSFSYSFSIQTDSKLFSYLGFAQHLASLAIVQAIKQLAGDDLTAQVQIKWPNDVYWNNRHKLVGILTTSKIEGNRVQFHIGCGVNLANRYPSRSLNNLLHEHLAGRSDALTPEQLVAGTLAQMEQLLSWFERVEIEAVKQRYYQHWSMGGGRIRLKDGTQAEVDGVDDYGYLRVRCTPDGQLQSLQPDGNRFDMISNLSVTT